MLIKERNFQMTHSDIDKKLSSILKKCQGNFSEKLVELCRHTCADYGGALKFGSDEPGDLVLALMRLTRNIESVLVTLEP